MMLLERQWRESRTLDVGMNPHIAVLNMQSSWSRWPEEGAGAVLVNAEMQIVETGIGVVERIHTTGRE